MGSRASVPMVVKPEGQCLEPSSVMLLQQAVRGEQSLDNMLSLLQFIHSYTPLFKSFSSELPMDKTNELFFSPLFSCLPTAFDTVDHSLLEVPFS